MNAETGDHKRARRELLETISTTAQMCREIEDEFRRNPPPTLEVLIKIHRVFLMKLIKDFDDPPSAEDMRLVTGLIKPAMEFANIEEKRADRRLVRERLRAARQSQLEAGLEVFKVAFRGHPEAIELLERGYLMVTGQKKSLSGAGIEVPAATGADPIDISHPVGPPTDYACRTENGPLLPCKP